MLIHTTYAYIIIIAMFEKLLVLACNFILNVILRGVFQSRRRAKPKALRLGFRALVWFNVS